MNLPNSSWNSWIKWCSLYGFAKFFMKIMNKMLFFMAKVFMKSMNKMLFFMGLPNHSWILRIICQKPKKSEILAAEIPGLAAEILGLAAVFASIAVFGPGFYSPCWGFRFLLVLSVAKASWMVKPLFLVKTGPTCLKKNWWLKSRNLRTGIPWTKLLNLHVQNDPCTYNI